MARLRPASNSNYWRFYGANPPAWWVGIVAEDEHMLLGIGGVYALDDGRLFCCFDKAPGVHKPLMMQRAARVLLDALKEAGIKHVHALCDPRIAGAQKWLTRLGFVETDEMLKEHKVWRWALS